jgi:hypothetical protein
MKILVTKYLVMEKVDHGDSSYLLRHPRERYFIGISNSTIFEEYGYDTQEEATDAVLKSGSLYSDYVIITSICVSEET